MVKADYQGSYLDIYYILLTYKVEENSLLFLKHLAN